MRSYFLFLFCLLFSAVLSAQTGEVNVRVWNDKDGDGVQDNNEGGGIAGVPVTLLEDDGSNLLRPDGTEVTASTNGSGIAVLDYVPTNRSFRVKIDVPDFHKVTGLNQGSNDSKDSDIGNDGRTAKYSLSGGSQNRSDIDAGLWAPGTVLARTWHDKDGDGIQDNNEGGFKNQVYGVKVTVLNKDKTPFLFNGQPVSAVSQCGNGVAALYPVPADRQFRLKFEKLAGATISPMNQGSNDSKDSDAGSDGITGTYSADRGSQNFTNIDAGFPQRGVTDSEVIARVWNDTDGDGKQDGNENGQNIANANVFLLDQSGNPCACEQTSANGLVTLNGIGGEKYRLQFELLPDHAYTGRNKTSDNQDSDAKSDGTTDLFTAPVNGTTTNQDAGFWAPGTVQARVWNDLDGDGKQDGNESSANIQGVQVDLLDANNGNAVIGSGMTNSNGIAMISGVPANRPVRLKFHLPADHAFTGRNKTNDNEDSDAKSDGTTDTFQADRGSDSHTNQDAGLWAPGTVQARVWNDLDGDGKQDGNESGANISGVKVELLDANNGNTVLGYANTDVNGIATITDVPADRPMRLKFNLPTDHAFTGRNKTSDNEDSDAKSDGTTDTFQADRGSDNHLNQDAGLWAPGTIEARVWNDLDGDGKQDGNESGANISGVKVELLDANNGNTVLGYANTDVNGIATITDVPADRPMRLKFHLLANHAFTGRNKANNDNEDSDAKSDGTTDTFQADRGNDSHTNQDAGLWAPGTVLARVWNDLDGDGKQDGNESNANISGVVVELLDASNNNAVLVTSSTNGSGIAMLPNVPADRPVRLRFNLPSADHAFTGRNKAGDSEDSDAKSDGTTDTFSASKGSQVHTIHDAGLWAPGTVQARVWNDLDGDGKQDGNESNANIAGVQVDLLDASNGNTLLKSTDTDANGIATITGVPANRAVRLKFHLPAGYSFTVRNKAAENEDSDAKSDGTTDTFQADRGNDLHVNQDAGLIVDPLESTNPFANSTRPTFDQALEQPIKLYPNPAVSYVTIEVNAEQEVPAMYQIRDLNGRVIQSASLDLVKGFNQFQINLQDMPTGQYFLQWQTADYQETKSFIITQ